MFNQHTIKIKMFIQANSCYYEICDVMAMSCCHDGGGGRGTDQLTPKHRETHGCVVSTVATDALVLKHQAIRIHNAD